METINDLTEKDMKPLGFEHVEQYEHDGFITHRYMKGCLEVEFTYGSDFDSVDVTIDEVIGLPIDKDSLSKLDEILNKNTKTN